MKTCEDCLKEKSEKDDFYRHPRTGAASICKSCTMIAQSLRKKDPVAYEALKVERRRRRRLVLIPDHKVCPKCDVDKALTDFRVKARGLYGRSSWCLECEGKASKAYVNGPQREEILERRRDQWASTSRSNEQKREAAERARSWYRTNQKRHRQSNALWIAANPIAFRKIQKRYQVKSPGWTRRAAYMARVEKTLTAPEWLRILEWFDHKCAYCFAETKLTMDHVIPVSKGGPHTAENVVPACKSCNSTKHARPIWVMLNVKEISHGQTI